MPALGSASARLTHPAGSGSGSGSSSKQVKRGTILAGCIVEYVLDGSYSRKLERAAAQGARRGAARLEPPHQTAAVELPLAGATRLGWQRPLDRAEDRVANRTLLDAVQ